YGYALAQGRANNLHNATIAGAEELLTMSESLEAELRTRINPGDEAKPGSILDTWAKKRWGAYSWKYRIYTVFGTNWEALFQVPVLLAAVAGLSMPYLISIAIVWAVVFSGAHKGRNLKEKIVLLVLGLVLAGALVAPYLCFAAGVPFP